jgi:hypothetical protein
LAVSSDAANFSGRQEMGAFVGLLVTSTQNMATISQRFNEFAPFRAGVAVICMKRSPQGRLRGKKTSRPMSAIEKQSRRKSHTGNDRFWR